MSRTFDASTLEDLGSNISEGVIQSNQPTTSKVTRRNTGQTQFQRHNNTINSSPSKSILPTSHTSLTSKRRAVMKSNSTHLTSTSTHAIRSTSILDDCVANEEVLVYSSLIPTNSLATANVVPDFPLQSNEKQTDADFSHFDPSKTSPLKMTHHVSLLARSIRPMNVSHITTKRSLNETELACETVASNSPENSAKTARHLVLQDSIEDYRAPSRRISTIGDFSLTSESTTPIYSQSMDDNLLTLQLQNQVYLTVGSRNNGDSENLEALEKIAIVEGEKRENIMDASPYPWQGVHSKHELGQIIDVLYTYKGIRVFMEDRTSKNTAHVGEEGVDDIPATVTVPGIEAIQQRLRYDYYEKAAFLHNSRNIPEARREKDQSSPNAKVTLIP